MPQHANLWSAPTAQAKSLPALKEMKVPEGKLFSLDKLSPQHTRLPSVLSPQEKASPP